MKKGVFRLCAGLLAVVLLLVAVVPCYAESDKYTSTGTFWQAVADKWYFNWTVIPAIIGTVSDKVCSESGDKKHHGSLKSYEQNPDKSYTAICDFCSAEFPVYDADLSAAYDDYVQTLPATSYTSAGGFIWYPVVSDISYFWPDLINDAFDRETLDLSSRSFSISLRTLDHPLMTTPFDDYTVTEGLLLLLLLSVFVSACVKLLKGGFAWLR